MATTTPRIGLTKPDGTDLVDIAVLNTNFDKIDSNIASTKIQATKPTTANAGDLWWDSDTGTLYLYYVDANSSQWVAATSDPINIGVVANQTERDAQYPTPAQGMSVYRTDLGVTQRYYGLFNSSTNPGGRDVAGWYNEEKNRGLVPIQPTSIAFVAGSGSMNSFGVVSFTAVQQVELRGIFSSKYRNYKIIYDANKATGASAVVIYVRMMSGTSAITTNYANGFNGIEAGYTATSNMNQTSIGALTYLNNTGQFTGGEITVFKPNLAAPTQIMADTIGYAPGNSMYRSQAGILHNSSTPSDGLVLGISDGDTYTGKVQVFGIMDN